MACLILIMLEQYGTIFGIQWTIKKNRKESQSSDMNVLEPGCGTGLTSLELIARRGANVVLLDFSPAAIKIAKRLARKRGLLSCVDFILGDLRSLSLRDNCFDLVWNQGVVEHFDGEDRQRVVDEMSRVAKTNAVVMIMTPNGLNPIYRLKKTKLFHRGQYVFESAYLLTELVDKVEKARLKVVKIGGIKSLSPMFWFVPVRIGSVIKSTLDATPSWISVNSNPFNLLNRTLGTTLVVICRKKM